MNKPFREELDAFETKSFIYNYEVDSFGKVEKIIEQEYHKSRDALVERVEGLELKLEDSEKWRKKAFDSLEDLLKVFNNPHNQGG